MKDNYSWLDEVLFKIRTTREVEHNDNQWSTEFVYSLEESKQAIISQIEIEKLRARIEETEMLRDKIWAFLHVLPATMGDKQAINSIDYEFEEELTHLTEKLKELRR